MSSLEEKLKELEPQQIAIYSVIGLVVIFLIYSFFFSSSDEEEEEQKLLRDAKHLEALGCFAIVLEKIPAQLAAEVTKALNIPVIGIGAGPDVDGQVLVTHDVMGITKDFKPRFLRRYLELFDTMKTATEEYIKDVKSGDFPNEKEQY